jgi:signal transduction histidine kinase
MRRIDVITAALLAVSGFVFTLVVDGTDFTAFARAVDAFAAAVPVAFRHARPVRAALATTAILTVFTVVDQDYTQSFSPLVAFVLCAYSLGAAAPTRQFVMCGATMLLGAWAASFAADDFHELGASFLFAALILTGPGLAIGRLTYRRAATARLLGERAAELEAERERAPARAAALERARVAAELHELVAGAVHEMLSEAATARAIIARGDPGGAHAAGRVEERGRDALVDMRRLLGVLREGDAELELAPQPTLVQLDVLARRHERDGLAVRIASDGAARRLPPGLDVAAYRVVEDALAVARGAGSADVCLRWRPSSLEVEVAVDGPQLADGTRLGSVRERVDLFGGSLRLGRRGRAGSALVASVPDSGGDG